jgi:hypothetical protein
MLDQGTTLIELGKTDRNAAANGALAVMGCPGLRNRRSCPRPTQDSTWAPCRQISTESPWPSFQRNGRPFPVNGLGLKRQITHP